MKNQVMSERSIFCNFGAVYLVIAVYVLPGGCVSFILNGLGRCIWLSAGVCEKDRENKEVRGMTGPRTNNETKIGDT